MDEVASWLQSLGIRDIPCLDGKIRRVKRDNRASKSGWYIGWREPFLLVIAGDWRTGEKWTFKPERALTRYEQSLIRQELRKSMLEAERERVRMRSVAALRADIMWRSAKISGADDHPYCGRKQIPAIGARVLGDELLIPISDSDGYLWGLQRIFADGRKLFLPGQRVEGCFHMIGEPTDTIFICEGYATAASIHLATGSAVFAAWSAGNLREVARQIRTRYPEVTIIIAGDDDQWTPGNPGRAKAIEAAAMVCGRAVFPSFKNLDTRPTDFNDLHLMAGLDAVRQALAGGNVGDDRD